MHSRSLDRVIVSTDDEEIACFIAAEAGVNHNGDVELARRLVGVAAKAGAEIGSLELNDTRRPWQCFRLLG